jgi:hypothetical protein
VQEPVHHQFGFNLKLRRCGVHDCAGPPSLLARNPAENFGGDWWVVDVAVDRGTIRHDLFPKRSDYCEGPDQRCYRPEVLTIGSKDIVLEYIVPKAPRDGACDLCEPRRRFLERLDQRLRRERFFEIGEASGLKRSGANGWAIVSSHEDDRHGNPSGFETMPQLDA